MTAKSIKTKKISEPEPSAPLSRLGECQICKDSQQGKYTCPKCEMITCSLPCVKKHKKDFACDGIRSKTKYVPAKKLDDLNILSDYRLLESLGRCVEACKRDTSKSITRKNLPLNVHLRKFRKAMSDRKSRIYFMPRNFAKHKENTTVFDWKDQRINWKLEVTFLHAKNYKMVVNKCSEDVILETIVAKCLKASSERKKEYRKHFEAYQSAKSDIQVLLKAEKIPGTMNKFFLLDNSKSLKENLVGKKIVEHPDLYVTVKGFCSIIDEAQDNKLRKKSKSDSLLLSSYSVNHDQNNNSSDSENNMDEDSDEGSHSSDEDNSWDRAFDLLHEDEHKELLKSLYKSAMENP